MPMTRAEDQNAEAMKEEMMYETRTRKTQYIAETSQPMSPICRPKSTQGDKSYPILSYMEYANNGLRQ